MIWDCVKIQTSAFAEAVWMLFVFSITPWLISYVFSNYNLLREYNSPVNRSAASVYGCLFLLSSGFLISQTQHTVRYRLQAYCKPHICFCCLDSHRNVVTACKAGLVPAKYSFNGITFSGDWGGLAAIWSLQASFLLVPWKWIALPQAVEREIKNQCYEKGDERTRCQADL